MNLQDCNSSHLNPFTNDEGDPGGISLGATIFRRHNIVFSWGREIVFRLKFYLYVSTYGATINSFYQKNEKNIYTGLKSRQRYTFYKIRATMLLSCHFQSILKATGNGDWVGILDECIYSLLKN